MNKDILSVIMCPRTKESLSICDDNEVDKILRNTEHKEKAYLINESKTFLYKVSHHGFPILLPEEAIDISNIADQNDLSDFKVHRQDLENVYKKIDFDKNPFADSSESFLYWRTAITKPLVDNLIPGDILDAGGGFGFFRRFSKGRFHLNIDVSENMLSYDPSDEKILGRSEKMPIQNNSFDNVLSVGSIEHCEDVRETLSELIRCLKPGGRLLVACYSDDWPAILKNTVWGLTYYNYLLETYREMFKQNPSLLIQYAFYKLKIRKKKPDESFKPLWGGEEAGKINVRTFNMNYLEKLFTELDVKVLKKGRCGKNFPGQIPPPRSIIERCFDPMKYGQYLFFVCSK